MCHLSFGRAFLDVAPNDEHISQFCTGFSLIFSSNPKNFLKNLIMGSYLSEPVVEKVSSDESNDKLVYGASSMQGWRVKQEVRMTLMLIVFGRCSFC